MKTDVNFETGSVSDIDWEMSDAKWERSGVPAKESNKGENRWEQ
jgi:hypothetical protein